MAPRETPRPPDTRLPDARTPSEPTFERFQLDTEWMGDGRQIHYYRWPEPKPDPDLGTALAGAPPDAGRDV